jgi:hypothetical protein
MIQHLLEDRRMAKNRRGGTAHAAWREDPRRRGWRRRLGVFAYAMLGAVAVIQIVQPGGRPRASTTSESKKHRRSPFTDFANPEMVQILGYDDNQGNSHDAMEPFISRDGNYLFFNDSNSAPETHLYWATRIDDVTFQFQGEIGGDVNSSGALNAVASMDDNGDFLFTTTRSYSDGGAPGYLSTLYIGPFVDGNVAPVAPAAGMAAPKYGLINFDSEISADGNTIYFTRGDFSSGSLTKTKMMVANRSGGQFVVSRHSARIMRRINNKYLNYAADISASELEFFFTRTNLKVGPAIYMATRKSKTAPFRKPKKITAITGFAEAPSISPDELSLYYHVKSPSGVFVINRVTRSPNP